MKHKSEEPTPRRLRKAREEGDSGASSYAAQALAFVVALVTIPAAARALYDWSANALRETIAQVSDAQALAVEASAIAKPIVLLSVPVLAAAAITMVAATLVQTGGVLTVRTLTPRLGRLDPWEGAARLVSRDHLFAIARAFLLAALIGYLTYLGLRAHTKDIAALAGRPDRVLSAGATIALRLARDAALFGLFAGIVDIVVRRQSWLSRLRMTKEEVARERKESEGDPEWKAARARAHTERMASASLAEIRRATVLVRGAKIACALRYEDGDTAPVVITRDEGPSVERVVELAREHDVAVVENAELASALGALPVGEPIPERLYDGVADVIHRARARI